MSRTATTATTNTTASLETTLKSLLKIVEAEKLQRGDGFHGLYSNLLAQYDLAKKTTIVNPDKTYLRDLLNGYVQCKELFAQLLTTMAFRRDELNPSNPVTTIGYQGYVTCCLHLLATVYYCLGALDYERSTERTTSKIPIELSPEYRFLREMSPLFVELASQLVQLFNINNDQNTVEAETVKPDSLVFDEFPSDKKIDNLHLSLVNFTQFAFAQQRTLLVTLLLRVLVSYPEITACYWKVADKISPDNVETTKTLALRFIDKLKIIITIGSAKNTMTAMEKAEATIAEAERLDSEGRGNEAEALVASQMYINEEYKLPEHILSTACQALQIIMVMSFKSFTETKPSYSIASEILTLALHTKRYDILHIFQLINNNLLKYDSNAMNLIGEKIMEILSIPMNCDNINITIPIMTSSQQRSGKSTETIVLGIDWGISYLLCEYINNLLHNDFGNYLKTLIISNNYMLVDIILKLLWKYTSLYHMKKNASAKLKIIIENYENIIRLIILIDRNNLFMLTQSLIDEWRDESNETNELLVELIGFGGYYSSCSVIEDGETPAPEVAIGYFIELLQWKTTPSTIIPRILSWIKQLQPLLSSTRCFTNNLPLIKRYHVSNKDIVHKIIDNTKKVSDFVAIRTTYLQTLASLEEQHKLLLPSLKQCSNLKEIVTLWLEDANLQHVRTYLDILHHKLPLPVRLTINSNNDEKALFLSFKCAFTELFYNHKSCGFWIEWIMIVFMTMLIHDDFMMEVDDMIVIADVIESKVLIATVLQELLHYIRDEDCSIHSIANKDNNDDNDEGDNLDQHESEPDKKGNDETLFGLFQSPFLWESEQDKFLLILRAQDFFMKMAYDIHEVVGGWNLVNPEVDGTFISMTESASIPDMGAEQEGEESGEPTESPSSDNAGEIASAGDIITHQVKTLIDKWRENVHCVTTTTFMDTNNDALVVKFRSTLPDLKDSFYEVVFYPTLKPTSPSPTRAAAVSAPVPSPASPVVAPVASKIVTGATEKPIAQAQKKGAPSLDPKVVDSPAVSSLSPPPPTTTLAPVPPALSITPPPLTPTAATPSELPPPIQLPRVTGYITKQGSFFPTWKRRYFVLEQRKLIYFANPEDAEKGKNPLGQPFYLYQESDNRKTMILHSGLRLELRNQNRNGNRESLPMKFEEIETLRMWATAFELHCATEEQLQNKAIQELKRQEAMKVLNAGSDRPLKL